MAAGCWLSFIDTLIKKNYLMKMELPPGYALTVSGSEMVLSAPGGLRAEHFYDSKLVAVTVEGVAVKVEAKEKLTRKVQSAVRTTEAHIRNMVKGLGKNYEKKLSLVYAHFPVSLEVKGDVLMIKNFLGEKKPRRAAIVGKTKIKVAGQEIVVEGPDKDAVGQTANNIAKAVRITNKDNRVFQDGIYYS